MRELPATPGGDNHAWQISLTCEIMGNDLFLDNLGNPVLDNGKPIVCPGALPVTAGLARREAKASTDIASVVSAFNPPAGALSANPNVLAAIQILQDMKTTLDSTRTDLLGYGLRVGGIITNPPPSNSTVGTLPVVSSTAAVIPQVIYNVNAINLIGVSQSTTDNSKKQLVVAITVVYGDVRWEVSAGTFFSSLPIRSFSAAPVFTNDVVTDKKVSQQIVRPLVIPFAAVNYRVSNDWVRPNWRTNFYFTGAVGINPNTVSTDFATGPSIAYRALMFSALWHIGHDTRLTQGVKVKDSLGAGFSGSLPTQTYWRFDSVAIGISIRTPSLTNR